MRNVDHLDPCPAITIATSDVETKTDAGSATSRGALIEAYSAVYGWCLAEIMDRNAQGSILVHFVYHSRRRVEWVRAALISPRGTNLWVQGTPLRAGLRVDFREAQGARWLQGRISELSADGRYAAVTRELSSASDTLEVPVDASLFAEFESNTRNQVVKKLAFWEGRVRAPARGLSDVRNSCLSAFLAALQARGAVVEPMGGDGNCLFRAVADQTYGSQELHAVTRAAAADYMRLESAFFRGFVADDDGGWESYLTAIRAPGTWGDDPEIQALCEIYGRPAEIWAYDSRQGAQQLRVFNGASQQAGAPADTRTPIRLSYYGGGHYDSVRGVGWETALLRSPPGVSERVAFAAAARRAASSAPGAMLSSLRESDAAATDAEALDAALTISRAAFDRMESMNIEEALQVSLAGARREGRVADVSDGLRGDISDSSRIVGDANGAKSEADALALAIQSSAAEAEARALSAHEAEIVSIAVACSLQETSASAGGHYAGAGSASGGNTGSMSSSNIADAPMAEDDDDLQRALTLSLSGGDIGANETFNAAFELTEEEQLLCLYSNTRPQDFLRDKLARLAGR